MKHLGKTVSIIIMCIIIFQGFSFTHIAHATDDNTEFWGIVIVSLSESLHPYVYNGLMKTNNWEPSHIRLLWKNNATKENIITAIQWLQSKADDTDYVLLSVDAHGVYNGEEYGIWPSDGSDNGMITINELDQEIRRINAKGICLFFDCCFSGTFATPSNSKDLKSLNYVTYKHSLSTDLSADGRVILMSTQPQALGIHWMDYNLITGEPYFEVSPSSTISEVFEKSYDPNSDGILSAEEAYTYLQTHFRKYALKGFINIPIQLYCYLAFGRFTIPFPCISDNFDGELPIVFL